jgi:leucyl-tRNA synthetase
MEAGAEASGSDDENKALRRATHKLIKAVTEAVGGFRFNAGIAQFYAFLNTLKTLEAVQGPERIAALKALTVLINPITPHLAESCWERLGGEGMVVDASWPSYDPALAMDDLLLLPVQVNGKRRGEVQAAPGASEDAVREIALADAGVMRHLEGLTLRKVIVVKDRIVNIVAN